MSNYKESKKKLDVIQSAYSCKGGVIFTAAMQCVIEWGQKNFTDKEFLYTTIAEIDQRHDKAEKDGKILFMSRDFEKSIIECASKIAEVNTYDLMVYIQREMYLNNGLMDGEPGYQRAISLLREVVYWIDQGVSDNNQVRDALYDIGFEDDELIYFGCEYLVEEEEDDE